MSFTVTGSPRDCWSGFLAAGLNVGNWIPGFLLNSLLFPLVTMCKNSPFGVFLSQPSAVPLWHYCPSGVTLACGFLFLSGDQRFCICSVLVCFLFVFSFMPRGLCHRLFFKLLFSLCAIIENIISVPIIPLPDLYFTIVNIFFWFEDIVTIRFNKYFQIHSKINSIRKNIQIICNYLLIFGYFLFLLYFYVIDCSSSVLL